MSWFKGLASIPASLLDYYGLGQIVFESIPNRTLGPATLATSVEVSLRHSFQEDKLVSRASGYWYL